MRAWTCQADNVQLDGVHLIMFSSHPWVSGWCLFLFQTMIPLDPSFFGLKPPGLFLPFWTGDLKTSARHGVDAHVDQQSCMLVVRDEKCWRSFVSQLRCAFGTSHRRGLDEWPRATVQWTRLSSATSVCRFHTFSFSKS